MATTSTTLNDYYTSATSSIGFSGAYATATTSAQGWYQSQMNALYYPTQLYEPVRETPKPKGFVEDLRSEINEWLKDALI